MPEPNTPPPEPEGAYYLPNAFSPNGDGNNDILRVRGGEITGMHLTIFNRWGQQVFEAKNQETTWDGTHNGKALNAGVYVFKIKYTLINGSSFEETGNVTLMR